MICSRRFVNVLHADQRLPHRFPALVYPTAAAGPLSPLRTIDKICSPESIDPTIV